MPEQENNSQAPDNWTPEMSAMPEKNQQGVIADPNDQQQAPQYDQRPPTQQEQDEDPAYWRNEFLKTKAENERLSQYQGIIGKLETDPDLVTVLSQHINGEAAALQQQSQSSDSIEDGDIFGVESADAQGYTKADLEKAKRAGETQGQDAARIQAEITAVLQTLQSQGVPDHVQKEFIEFMNNPSGTTVMDLYHAFTAQKQRQAPPQGQPPNQSQAPAAPPQGQPLATMEGGTDRPDGEDAKRYVPIEGGVGYTGDPNAL